MSLHFLAHHRQLVLAAALASLLLSLWALYLDPVINMDGILYVEAAGDFARGDWAAGFAVYKWPFYSLIIGSVSFLTGIAEGKAAYLVNAGLYALVVLGFIALVRVLGGRGRVLWLAAALVLLHPELNAFRSFVIRDVGYWACYLWTLVFYLAYVHSGRARLLSSGILLAICAFLFRVEGIVLLTILPACIYAYRTGTGKRANTIVLLAALATGAAVAAAPLWHYVSEVKVSMGALLAQPLHHLANSWEILGADTHDRLAALQREFSGVTSYATSVPVYLVTVLTMALLESIKAVGVVFAGLIIYAFCRSGQYIQAPLRCWWWLMIGIQATLILQFGITNFFLAKRYPVALALTLLPIVPFLLDDLWRRWETRGRKNPWPALIIAVLIGIQSLDGLNVGTRKHYLKDAGLWLRSNAPPGSSIYSNDRILLYYAGAEERRPGTGHSWDAAMQEVWSDGWRNYDYFVLAMPRIHAQHEVLLLREINAEPVKTFSNGRGDEVLIFKPG